MIDTVPSNVKLTDVIEPMEVKPTAVSLKWDTGKVLFMAEVRVSIRLQPIHSQFSLMRFIL